MEYSPNTLKWLRRAGWTEERRIDTEDYRRCFLAEGYPIIPEVMDFLSRFGDLYIWHDDLYGYVDADMFHFNPFENFLDYKQIHQFVDVVNKPICLVGEMRKGHMQLLMDADTRIYGCFGELLVVIGEIEVDGIEAICTHRPPLARLT